MNTGNRKVRRSCVLRYAADMKTGRWHVGTSAIVIDGDGVLIDGQHRLLACVEADTPFETLVVEGVDPHAKVGIDQGSKRTLSDVLAWKGEMTGAALAATVRTGWTWARTTPFNRAYTPTADEALDWLERNPSVREAVREASSLRRQFGCPISAVAAVIHRVRLVEPDAAEEFIAQVETGAQLSVGMPSLALRNWMTGQAASASTARRPIPAVYHFIWVKAWNAYVLGKETKLLKYVRREEFPEVLDATGSPVKLVDEVELVAS